MLNARWVTGRGGDVNFTKYVTASDMMGCADAPEFQADVVAKTTGRFVFENHAEFKCCTQSMLRLLNFYRTVRTLHLDIISASPSCTQASHVKRVLTRPTL